MVTPRTTQSDVHEWLSARSERVATGRVGVEAMGAAASTADSMGVALGEMSVDFAVVATGNDEPGIAEVCDGVKLDATLQNGTSASIVANVLL